MSSPKNILYISPNAHLGGAERGCELFLMHHDRQKYLPSILFLRDGPLVEQFRNHKVEVGLMPTIRLREFWRHRSLIRKISKYIQEKDIALVHNVMGYGHFFGGRAALEAKIPSVWFQHGPVIPRDRWISLIPTNAILVNSHFTASEQKRIMLRSFPIEVVTPGGEFFNHDTGVLRQKREKLRTKLGLTTENFVVGVVGRIDSWKGQLQLVKALAEAIKTKPQVRGLIIGNADLGNRNYENEIREFIKTQNLEKKIIMPGFVEDLELAYASLDLFVHSAVSPEPFGMVIVEAMAYRIPVIAAPTGGVKEIIQDGVNGCLVDPLNIKALTNKIIKLSENKILREELQEKAFNDAKSKYTPEQFTKQVEWVYDRILHKKNT